MSDLGTEAAREPSGSAVVKEREAGKIAFAAFVGTALEWYDYFLFGTAAALVFNGSTSRR